MVLRTGYTKRQYGARLAFALLLGLGVMLEPGSRSRVAGAEATTSTDGGAALRQRTDRVEMQPSARDDLCRLFSQARGQADSNDGSLTQLLDACRIDIDSQPLTNTPELRRQIRLLAQGCEIHLQSRHSAQHLWLSPGPGPNSDLVALPPIEVTKLGRDVALVRWRLCASGTAKQIIDGLEKLGSINGVIIDVRDNPGGHLLEAVQLVEAFCPARTELLSLYRSTLDRQAKRPWMTLRSQLERRWHAPVAVITSGITASTAEALTAMLRSQLHAQVVGETTKGDATAYVLLKDEKATEATAAARPVPMLIEVAGVPLYQRAGLTPDVEIKIDRSGTQASAAGAPAQPSFARRCEQSALATLTQTASRAPAAHEARR